MNRKESLDFINQYSKNLKDKKESEEELKKLQGQRPFEVQAGPSFSFMRYFWPFLVLYPILTTILYVLFLAVFKVQTNGGMLGLMFLSLVVYFIAAIYIAHLRRDRASAKLYAERMEFKRQADKKRDERIAELQQKIDKCGSYIKTNQDKIPIICRNQESVNIIKDMLVNGKAETLEDAISSLHAA